MLIFAEGTVNEPLSDVERAAARAWLGPIVDEGPRGSTDRGMLPITTSDTPNPGRSVGLDHRTR
jgi:hypothetical protein